MKTVVLRVLPSAPASMLSRRLPEGRSTTELSACPMHHFQAMRTLQDVTVFWDSDIVRGTVIVLSEALRLVSLV